MKIKLIGAVLACVLVGTAAIGAERAANRRFEGGLKALGFKAYWSLLDEDQQGEAKAIIKDHVARTAPDRMEALSIMVRFRGEVARVLTVEQRLKAAGISRHMKGLAPLHSQRTVKLRRSPPLESEQTSHLFVHPSVCPQGLRLHFQRLTPGYRAKNIDTIASHVHE